MAMIQKTLDLASKSIELTPKSERNGILERLVPIRFTKGAGLAIVGGATALSAGNEIVKAVNRGKLGRISYLDGPMRLTASDGGDIVDSMEHLANGNEEIFQDLGRQIMESSRINKIDSFGATGDLVFALHNRR